MYVMIYVVAWLGLPIGPFHLASIIFWLVAVRITNNRLIDTSTILFDQNYEARRLRTIEINDLIAHRTITLLLSPWIVICIIITLMLAFSIDEFTVVLLMQLVSLIITTCVCFIWKHPREKGVRNATILTLAYWTITQSILLLSIHTVASNVSIYHELISLLRNILSHSDNSFTAVLLSIGAMISASAAAFISTKFLNRRSAWGLLALATPSVVLLFAWKRPIDPPLALDIGFTMNLFGLFAAAENARLVSYIDSAWFARDEVLATLKHNLRLMPMIAMVLMAVGTMTLLLSNRLTTGDEIYSFIVRWAIIATISVAVYFIARFTHTPHQALKWTMFVWMSATLILSIPTYEAKLNDPSFDAYDTFTREYTRFLDIHQLIALICLIVLFVALLLNRWRLALPCGVGTLYPSLFVQLFGPGLYQLPNTSTIMSYATWLDLSLMTIVFFFCIYYVLGPAGILKDNAPSDPTGELQEATMRKLRGETEAK